MNRLALLCLLAALGLSGCTTYRPLLRDLRRNPTLTDHLTGFALYDWEKQRLVVSHQANLYFTPASNTKLFSLYAGLVTLKDSLPALRYTSRRDSLIFWGTGNPAFLNPDLVDTTTLRFLRQRPERTLVFSPANYGGSRFGPGWSWDDYNDDYSPEVTPLPLYGNIVRFTAPDRIARIDIAPRIFADSLSPLTPRRGAGQVRRAELVNRFERPAGVKPFRQDVPFRWTPPTAVRLLSDTLKRPVALAPIPLDRAAKTLYGLPADSLYKRMMVVSDNLLAEHLLLLCSSVRDTLSVPMAIRTLLEGPLADLPDKPKWVDGSGLSRYNLMTPRSLVALLEKLYRTVPRERLFNLLAVGGQSGTLRAGFGAEKPYLFAKSGSMTGVYNLSGYLVTRKGKLYLFSMMHNNFVGPVADMRQRTERFLKEIYERY